MTLYLLTTKDLGDFYVVAQTANDAEYLLLESLDIADYGFNRQRKIINIKILAEEILDFPPLIPDFSSGNRLLISKYEK